MVVLRRCSSTRPVGYLDVNRPVRGAAAERGSGDADPDAARDPAALDAADEPVRTVLLCAVLTGDAGASSSGSMGGRRSRATSSSPSALAGEVRHTEVRRSRRTIDWRRRCERRWPRSRALPGGLVFCSPDGEPINPDNLRSARLGAGAPPRRASPHPVSRPAPHLCESPDRSGAHPKYIQAQLGHASIQTTLDRYGHLMPDASRGRGAEARPLLFGESSHAGSVRSR